MARNGRIAYRFSRRFFIRNASAVKGSVNPLLNRPDLPLRFTFLVEGSLPGTKGGNRDGVSFDTAFNSWFESAIVNGVNRLIG